MLAEWTALRPLMGHLWRSPSARTALLLGLAEEAAGLAFSIAAPLVLGRTVERLPTASSDERLALVFALVASWLAPSLLGAFKPVHSATIIAGLYRQLAPPLLRRQLPPLAILRDRTAGGLTGALERLPFDLQLVLDGLIWRAAPILVQVVLTLGALAWVLPGRYAVLLGATLVAYLVLADRSARRLLERAEAAIHSAGQLSSELGDVVGNAERVVCNGAIEVELQRLHAAIDRRDQAGRRLARDIAGATGGQTMLLIVGLCGVLGLAATGIGAPRLNAAGFVMLQAFALRLAVPLGGLAISMRQAGAALTDLSLTLALIGAPRTASAPAPIGSGPLQLNAVSFAYPGASHGVRRVSLVLAEGQMIVVVGANGSGKSTLARLMAGLLSPDDGWVRAGGVDLQTLSLEARSQRALYVPQFIGLFHRSLRENGLYPPATGDEADLIRRLEAWRFYPDGEAVSLTVDAGERGGALSGGQVQKLELARLCAVQTPILILDESTSALDAPSETELIRSLRAQASGRLLVLVTHKRRLAEAADQVIFLDKGEIAGIGRHDDLMAHAAYRDLWA